MNKMIKTALFVTMLASPVLAAPTDPAGMSRGEVAGKPHHGGGHHGKMFSALPEDKANLLRDSMKASHEKNAPLFEDSKRLKTERLAILKAPAYDQAAFEKNQAASRDVRAKMGMNRDAAFADALAKLSPEERAKLATAMEKRHDKRGHWGKRGGQHDKAAKVE